MRRQVMLVLDSKGNELITSTVAGVIKGISGQTYVYADTLASCREMVQELKEQDDEWKRYRGEFGKSRYDG